MRPLCAEVDLNAIRFNFDLLAAKAGRAKLIAVVKADAYGHGLVPVARVLSEKAAKLAVACLDEAMVLRAADIRCPIVVLEGFFSAEELLAGESLGGIEWVIHEEYQWHLLNTAALQHAHKIWLKINTGMNRLGFPPQRLSVLLGEARSSVQLSLQGVMTHFSCADEEDTEGFRQQLKQVQQLCGLLPKGVDFSAANSAVVLLHSNLCFQWVRPGISLYGGSPVGASQGEQFGLRPAMKLVSKIIACRDLSQGDAVGYGASWQAPGPLRMGVVAAGYGDGYPRQIGSGSPVWVDGRETQIIGRVSMDMVTVDLTGIPSATVGSPVLLWGGGLSVDRVARCANTISYHLLTGVTRRVPRRYQGAG